MPQDGASLETAPAPAASYILIVQQDRAEFESMRDALGPLYEIKTVGDGFDVLSEVLRRKPDLVILDLVLPGISGLEVIHALQSTRQNIPIIATIGADRRAEDWLRESIMGAAKLLRKPIPALTLCKWVEVVLRGDSTSSRSPEADDAAGLLLDHGRPKVVGEGEFRILLERAARMNHTYDRESSVLLLQARSKSLRDCVTRVASNGLRSGDFAFPYLSDKLAVLLPLTTQACIPPILERLGKNVESKGYALSQMRCGATSVARALPVSDWNVLFDSLVPWNQNHKIGSE